MVVNLREDDVAESRIESEKKELVIELVWGC